jgi:hypothetical protein
MSSTLFEWYRQAAEVVGTLINKNRYPMRRDVALNRHRWYATLDPYDALEEHFKNHEEISSMDLEWLKERAISRNGFIIFSDYTPKELFINDVMDIMDYYNHAWERNPPKGYIVPATFYL